eukprot:scaffold17216_cov64-Cyclotella_meneghiniana.AAC.2
MPYFIESLTDILFFVLPAGNVFQTEPPDGCLRQAFVFGTHRLLSIRRGRGCLTLQYDKGSTGIGTLALALALDLDG